MPSFTALSTLASLLALSTSVNAQTGTGSGLPIASVTLGGPYPFSNGTLPYGPTGTGTGVSLPTSPGSLTPTLPGTGPTGLPGSPIQSGTGASCPAPVTITTTTQFTVTVTVPASSAATPTAPASVPYPIPGSSGLPIGSGTGTGYGTGTGTGYAVATGYSKRMEMRGLKQERKERKRGARFW